MRFTATASPASGREGAASGRGKSPKARCIERRAGSGSLTFATCAERRSPGLRPSAPDADEARRRKRGERALPVLARFRESWSRYAYGDQLRGILRELPGSVGDGIFDKGHSRDARAAAFWFLFVGPLLGLFGRTYSAAERAGDV